MAQFIQKGKRNRWTTVLVQRKENPSSCHSVVNCFRVRFRIPKLTVTIQKFQRKHFGMLAVNILSYWQWKKLVDLFTKENKCSRGHLSNSISAVARCGSVTIILHVIVLENLAQTASPAPDKSDAAQKLSSPLHTRASPRMSISLQTTSSRTSRSPNLVHHYSKKGQNQRLKEQSKE